MKKIFAYIFLLSLVFCGCQNEDEPNQQKASIQLSANQLSFVNEYIGEQAVTVTSTGVWTASTNKSWCKISTTYGEAGTSRLNISVESNPNIASRTAIVTITPKDSEAKTLKVVQLGEQEEIVVFSPVMNIEGVECTLNVPLATNVENLDISIPQEYSWVKIVPAIAATSTKSSVEKNIVLQVSKNTGSEIRTATISFSGGRAAAVTLTINQKPQKRFGLKIENANFDENIGQRATGMQVKFYVNTAINYEMQIDGDWLQEISKSDDSYVFDMPANTGEERTGSIIVSNSDLGLADTLIVKQLANGQPFIGSRASDSIALIAIYNATDMKNWIPAEGKRWAFNIETPMSQWAGITLNNEGRVVKWEFEGTQKADVNFRFTIPAEIGNLTKLGNLFIDSWNLSNIPAALGELPVMDSIYLCGNLSGVIPGEICKMTSLKYLCISGDVQFNPSVPPSDFHICSLSGTIPAELTNLTNLTDFYLVATKVSGSIPMDINKMTKLKYLVFQANYNMTGAIPATIGQLSNLLEFNLMDQTGMSGIIPPELGNLSKLQKLVIAFIPTISGPIPPELCNLSNLIDLTLVDTGLSGALPSALGNLSKLEALRIYCNSNKLGLISGTLPPSMALLRNLKAAILYNNEITGTVPVELDILMDNKGMWQFVLSGNLLTGVLPPKMVAKSKIDRDNFAFCQKPGAGFTNIVCQ